MKLATLVALLPLTLAACTSRPSPALAGGAPPPSRPSTPAPATADDDPVALRAEGPAALERLLARRATMPDGPARIALDATIDRVAGQRYAAWSKLYWYTDLAAAQSVARAEGKPILALRLLGHLDDDLSCANSRLFRTVLYPDPAVQKLLRERFVLYWSSERPVPRVTVDYGDGRTLATTVTGNSAHYVLDADGRPLDVLPGLYAPSVFVAELTRTADQATAVRTLDADAWRTAMGRYHAASAQRAEKQWAGVRFVTLVDGKVATAAEAERAAAQAQRATISKARIEVPMLNRLDLGVDPGAAPTDGDVRTDAATRVWKLEAAAALPASSRALVTSLLPRDAAVAPTLTRLARGILAETLVNELSLRRTIHQRFVDELSLGDLAFAPLNAWIYAEVFHTPASDPWMGLKPSDVFTGLPGGAIVTAGTATAANPAPVAVVSAQ